MNIGFTNDKKLVKYTYKQQILLNNLSNHKKMAYKPAYSYPLNI